MSAISRELLQALESHPQNVPKAGRILICCVSDLNKSLSASLESVISERGFGTQLLESVSALREMSERIERDSREERFDAVILSNAFIGYGLAENNDFESKSELLIPLLKLLKNNGIVILRENFELFSVHLMTHLTKLLDGFCTSIGDAFTSSRLTLYGMNQVQDSVQAFSNFLDVFWIFNVQHDLAPLPAALSIEDLGTDNFLTRISTTRDFLDRTQYTEDNVKAYEWIFGKNFISPGGIEENRCILKKFKQLYPGQKMLDIGVGIGGGARQVAREFGVHVLGCDLSSNMIQHAFERLQQNKDHRVAYQIADATVYNYPPESFDVVYSRDCIQHIKNITYLFRNIFKCLKPGGELLITLYTKGHGQLKEKFLEYVSERKYFLRTREENCQILKDCGFEKIYSENNTVRFAEILIKEQSRVIKNQIEFIREFGEKSYTKMVKGWEDKLQFIADDNHNWVLLRAEKPQKYADSIAVDLPKQ